MLFLICYLKNNATNTIGISKDTIPKYWNSTSTASLLSTTTSTEYRNTYRNIKFMIPTGWSMLKDSVDDNSYKIGQFQLFNYAINSDSKGLAKGQNKIEGMIIVSELDVASSTEIFDGGMTIKTYFLPLSKETNTYLSLSIYGDVTNFNILDMLSKQIMDNYR